jgi:hypothetical protein
MNSTEKEQDIMDFIKSKGTYYMHTYYTYITILYIFFFTRTNYTP